jgi:hypothetical protein
VLRRLRGSNLNFRTTLLRKLKEAGIEPWPKLFQNLRANALTDLCEQYQIHQVCRWLGSTIDVAMRHYIIIKKRDYEGPAKPKSMDPPNVNHPNTEQDSHEGN